MTNWELIGGLKKTICKREAKNIQLILAELI